MDNLPLIIEEVDFKGYHYKFVYVEGEKNSCRGCWIYENMPDLCALTTGCAIQRYLSKNLIAKLISITKL